MLVLSKVACLYYGIISACWDPARLATMESSLFIPVLLSQSNIYFLKLYVFLLLEFTSKWIDWRGTVDANDVGVGTVSCLRGVKVVNDRGSSLD